MPTQRNELHRIYTVMDFSASSWNALEQASKIAMHFRHPLVALCSKEDFVEKQLSAQGLTFGTNEELLKSIQNKVFNPDFNVISSTNKWNKLVSEHLDPEKGATEIFVGIQTHKGAPQHISQNAAYKLAKTTNLPVFAWPEKTDRIKEVLLPLDNNKHSREKLYYGVLFAQMHNARLHLLMLNTSSTRDDIIALRNAGKQVEDYTIKHGVSYWLEERESSNSVKVINQYIEEKNIDVLFCSVEMEHNLSDIFKGTVPARLSETLTIPTFWIPERVSWGMIDVSI